MHQPKGFINEGQEHFDTKLKAMGFIQSINQCIYITVTGEILL
jgi:hypothetical protein